MIHLHNGRLMEVRFVFLIYMNNYHMEDGKNLFCANPDKETLFSGSELQESRLHFRRTVPLIRVVQQWNQLLGRGLPLHKNFRLCQKLSGITFCIEESIGLGALEGFFQVVLFNHRSMF